MPTDSALEAVKILRNGSRFEWYVIPLLAFVVYVYAVEIERKNWNLVFAGLAFWGMDWFNEIWNALVFHFTGFAPVWGAPGETAFLIMIGLNIEISFMFAIAGIVFCKMLLPNKKTKILGIPNRIFFAFANSIFCVFIEILLNSVGALTWEYSWWNSHSPILIVLLGYLPFFIMAFWVFDMERIRNKIFATGIIYAVDITAIIIFGGILGWL